MIGVLVWGAPDLPDNDGDHQGVDRLVRKTRVTASVMAVCGALMIAVLLAPVANAADPLLRFVDPPGDATGQPQDAEAGATIRTSDLNVGGGSIQIEVVDSVTKVRLTNFSKPISFKLATAIPEPGISAAVGDLDVESQIPVNGVATFGANTLVINTENEPQFTDYALVPISLRGPSAAGEQSAGFDIWEDGNSCTGAVNAPPCEAKLIPGSGSDTYTLSNVAGSLGASELFDELDSLRCPGQKEIFDDRIFSYATTETNDETPNTPVKLVSNITKADWRASANNGQAHADWCIGLLSKAPWENNGADYQEIDTNGALPGGVLFVALAPKCPTANPAGSAPCIVSQNSDGKGGSVAIGWLPGGDPPRRT